jgi:hypothetical protein
MSSKITKKVKQKGHGRRYDTAKSWRLLTSSQEFFPNFEHHLIRANANAQQDEILALSQRMAIITGLPLTMASACKAIGDPHPL